MAHRKPPCPVAGSRVVPRVLWLSPEPGLGAWGPQPLGTRWHPLLSSSVVQTRPLARATSRIGTRLWVL